GPRSGPAPPPAAAARGGRGEGNPHGPAPAGLPAGPVPAAPATRLARRAGGAAWRRSRSLHPPPASPFPLHLPPSLFSPAAFPPVPPPRRDEDRVDTVVPRELADSEPGDLRVAAPLPLAGHDHVHVERGQQPQALRAGVVIDPGEGFVQRDQPRRVRVAGGLVVRRRGGEQRNRGGQSPLATRGRAGRRAPLPVLVPLDP